MMSTLYLVADEVSSGNWSTEFQILTVNVTVINVLHLGNVCLDLSSVADFFNSGARAPTSAGHSRNTNHKFCSTEI